MHDSLLSKFVWKGRGNCTEMTRCAFAKSSVAHGQYVVHATGASAVLILILGCVHFGLQGSNSYQKGVDSEEVSEHAWKRIKSIPLIIEAAVFDLAG